MENIQSSNEIAQINDAVAALKSVFMGVVDTSNKNAAGDLNSCLSRFAETAFETLHEYKLNRSAVRGLFTKKRLREVRDEACLKMDDAARVLAREIVSKEVIDKKYSYYSDYNILLQCTHIIGLMAVRVIR